MVTKEIQEKRRIFVNREVAMKLRGRKVSKAQIRRVFKQAWREAKRKIK